ncbi:hypothetical protein HNQ56_002475 [Anaerotaenia torta]|uniref:DUF4829 domain-containing protein n=1 Tax=Anaerotaenia torta TaxID=433293 RepID=UPI003D19E6B8
MSRFLSLLAFGETGVKERVKNILHYKKSKIWVSAVAIIMVAAVSLILMISRQAEGTSAALQEEKGQSSQGGPDIQSSINDQGSPNDASNPMEATPSQLPDTIYADAEYNKIKISSLSENKGVAASDMFETTNARAVSYIDESIRGSKHSEHKESLKNNYTDQYQIEVSNEIGGYSCLLYYDTLNNKAYIERDGGLCDTGTDFARYIASLFEHTDITFDMDAPALFEAYGWTLDYQISGMKNKLGDIKALSGFNPNAYYFAYNNELSKDIGLDMGAYSNTTNLEVEIYKIRESMPQEFYPIQNCRGIAVKSEGRIIGAFISAGRHSTFNACSLKGNSFEKITGQTINDWLAGKVKADIEEDRLSQLKPEEIIEEYFKALDKQDSETAKYCMSKKTLIDNLSVNMPDEELFNKEQGIPLTDAHIGESNFDNLKSVKLSKVEPIGEDDENTRRFRVYADLQYREDRTISSGEQFWDCSMVYESPQTGWKIEDFGH